MKITDQSLVNFHERQMKKKRIGWINIDNKMKRFIRKVIIFYLLQEFTKQRLNTAQIKFSNISFKTEMFRIKIYNTFKKVIIYFWYNNTIKTVDDFLKNLYSIEWRLEIDFHSFLPFNDILSIILAHPLFQKDTFVVSWCYILTTPSAWWIDDWKLTGSSF